MCGIGGLYHPRQIPSGRSSLLREMTSAMTHRGPDEDGFYEDPFVSLGMRRLNVIDLTTGSQPLTNEDGTIHVVFNGEIYGHDRLRETLQARGHVFRSTSDTEVLVHLYEEYGLDLFAHVDGMFGFALWDQKKKRLVVARDRFGIKPLFYTVPRADKEFAFASELPPLLGLPYVSKRLDPVALDQYFTLSYILHPRSVYNDIRKLQPGHFLCVEEGRFQEISYWSFPEPLPPATWTEVGTTLDQALSSSVKDMMRSDVPLGAFLSGGLDSSTVVYHMAHHSPRRVQTFSVRYRESSFDEGDLARETAHRLGTDHHEIWARPEDVRLLPETLTAFGEPFADPSQIPTHLVSGLARQHVTVALSGDGGDEVLGGYLTYVASTLADPVGRLPAGVRHLMRSLAQRLPVSHGRVSLDYKIKKFMDGCDLPPLERHGAWKYIFSPEEKKRLYSSDFQNKVGFSLDGPVFDQWKDLFDHASRPSVKDYQRLDLKTFLVDNNLTKVDRMSMAHSLEVRVPFLDLRVVEATRRMGPHHRIQRLQTKVLLRTIMKGRLSPQVLSGAKKGFAVPLAFWMRGPVKSYVDDILRPERLEKSGILNSSFVREIAQWHDQGTRDMNRQLWNLVCFQKWFEGSGVTTCL